MKTVLKNCRVLGTTHDKDMLHDIYVENGIIEINIKDPYANNDSLSGIFKDRFHLDGEAD